MFLFISLIFVVTTTISCGTNELPVSSAATKSHNVTTSIKENTTSNITLSSEGGSLLNKNLSISLLNENEAKIEAGNANIVKNKIQPRKGAPPINSSEEKDTLLNVMEVKSSNKTAPKFGAVEVVKTENITVSSNTTKDDGQTLGTKIGNTNNNVSVIENVNKTEVEHLKKPLVLSYDALANEGQHEKTEFRLPISKASSKTLVANQLPSPNNVNGTPKTVHVGAIGRSPELVIPVVITILVVPVFAVLGYLALKRGQEAWKNRHYKRMDFLLDGMYND